MPKQYSIPEMQQQIAQLTATMDLPGVPPDERAIYANTIARIQQEINARTNPGPINPPPPPPNPDPIKHTAPPSSQEQRIPPPFGGGAGGGVVTPPTKPTNNQSNQSPIRVIAPGKPADLTPDQKTDLQQTHLTADFNLTPPTVTIHWPAWDWGPRTYTEAQVRGLFSTALRDLVESKRAAQGRYQDLTQYLAWWRGIQYYRALTAFWGSAPNRRMLGLNRRDEKFTNTFDLITEVANKYETTL